MEKVPEKLKPFLCHGVEPVDTVGDNVISNCPFCGKEGHFYVNQETGQWDCKVCLAHGNIHTFLGFVVQANLRLTNDIHYQELYRMRGIPPTIYRQNDVCFNGIEWLIPIYNENNTVMDIRRWDGKQTISTGGCHLNLHRYRELYKCGYHQHVWICEGEWDCMALQWLLKKVHRFLDIVVGVPGAGTFKDKWCEAFRGKHCTICYDNDESGDKGSLKVARLLLGTVSKMDFLCWPATRPRGYDVRDFVLETLGRNESPDKSFEIFTRMIKSRHRQDKSSPEGGQQPGNNTPREKTATFKEVVAEFSKWVKVDEEFIRGLAIALAVCLSNEVPGEPLWFYIVAPPGGGKNVILMALQESHRTIFRSSLTPASLVSGFNTHPDPSLLPQLNGKTAVFKDGTELLAMHPDERKQAYGILRGAYDGRVTRSWGNGVNRDYKTRFNMLVGITPAIHGDNQSSMGERFLKYNMQQNGVDEQDKMRAAIRQITHEVKMEQDLITICRRFMLKEVNPDELPKLDVVYEQKIIYLAQLVSILRAQVERGYGGQNSDIKYRPVREVATRVVKELSKLARMLCHVFDKPEVDEEVYKIVRRVAIDTCTGYHVDIVRVLARAPDGATREQIAQLSNIPVSMIYTKLDDLEQLTIVEKRRADRPAGYRGVMPVIYKLTKHMATLWNNSVAVTVKSGPARAQTAQTSVQGK